MGMGMVRDGTAQHTHFAGDCSITYVCTYHKIVCFSASHVGDKRTFNSGIFDTDVLHGAFRVVCA